MKRHGIQIYLEGALQLVLWFQHGWNSTHDMPHHILHQQLAFEHSHHSPTVGHRGQLETVKQVKINKASHT